MKLRLTTVAVSVATLAAVTAPAFAGDWNNGAGSLKDSRARAAVAVPAPMPIPNSYGLGWYLRGDVGIGRAGSKDIAESGMQYGHNGVNGDGSVDQMIGPGPTSPFGTAPSWFNNNGKTLLSGGGGIGYHWSKSFRTDVTLEQRNTDEYTGRGTYEYNTRTTTTVGGVPTDTYRLTRGVSTDDTQLKSGAILLNGYYDVGTSHGFTPYIGAGVGLALLTANRQHSTNEVSCSYIPPVASQCPANNYSTSMMAGATSSINMLSFAAMATVGTSYALSQNTSIDVNYRYLFIDGQNIAATINGHNSKVTLGDIGEHQLRAGLRWDIN